MLAPTHAAVIALAWTTLIATETSAQAMAAPRPDAVDVAVAVRARRPPIIDGRDTDSAWTQTPVINGFRMFAPREGADPTIRTEARVLYDDRNLYVLVRSFDAHPDSIVGLLARRDTDGPPNDQVLLFIDSFHDRRTGFNLVANAAGVKSDYLLFDDSGLDQSWDGIWDVETSIDSLGWVAEFRIPLNQLRFSDHKAPTFGFLIGRWVGRSDERVSWPQYRRSKAGLVSQLGTLVGLRNVGKGGSLEVTPYVLSQSDNVSATGASAAVQTRPAAGADVKWLPRPNVAIVGTLNPDFGQVEADPSVLNLTGVEVFQAERRPFFLEGAGQLSFPLATDGSALFYSRRIGRRPALLDALGAADSPTETTILGAARLTARMGPTTSLSLLSSTTQEERGALRTTGPGRFVVEPAAHYGVARAQRNFRGGRSGVGLMLTRVDRFGNDSLIGAALPTGATAVASTAHHQSADGAFQLSGWLARSDVQGSNAAISRMQLSTVHGFQRPDDGTSFDSTRQSLSGVATYLSADKLGRGITRFGASYKRIDPGFDVNEMGFLTKAGVQSWSSTAGLAFTQAGRALGLDFRRASVTLGFGGDWTTDGLPLGRGISLNGTWEFPSQAQLKATYIGQLAGAYCSLACSRGGPALYDPPRQTAILDLTGTTRHALVPHVNLEWDRDDDGKSFGRGGQVDALWRIRSNLNFALAAYAFDARYAWYFYNRFGAATSDTAHYTFAQLDNQTRTLTGRFNYTMTRTLTAQWYAQAYLSQGSYAGVREIADARNRDINQRFVAYTDSVVAAQPGGVDFRQLRSNLVLRWEYRSGSTLFLVWSQGRDFARPTPGNLAVWPAREFGDLFAVAPQNTIALKATYWFSP